MADRSVSSADLHQRKLYVERFHGMGLKGGFPPALLVRADEGIEVRFGLWRWIGPLSARLRHAHGSGKGPLIGVEQT
jgi:hypothetical protein